MKRSLRRRLLVLLVAGALVPAVLAAGLGLAAVWGLGRLAREHASAAMSDEVRASIVTRVEGQSRTHDAVLERVRGSAEALASYVGWLYAHPDYFPAFLKGGTPLLPTPEGHLVNDPTTPVGVFVARTAKPGQSTWAEVGLLSFVDPLLAAGPDGAPPAARSPRRLGTRLRSACLRWSFRTRVVVSTPRSLVCRDPMAVSDYGLWVTGLRVPEERLRSDPVRERERL